MSAQGPSAAADPNPEAAVIAAAAGGVALALVLRVIGGRKAGK
ncbi:MAG TPA: hypothetical protein PKB03_03800 [Baekduia sp.]|nr:hypothetical protein [Baekduia sp.]